MGYDTHKERIPADKREADEDEIDTIAAHHDGEDWTEEELEEIERFKAYILSKRNEE